MLPELITPRRLLGCDGLPSKLAGCTVGLVAFCPLAGLPDDVAVEPLPRPLFSHVCPERQFVARIGDSIALIVERVYGGPVSATVVEELAHYGIRSVVAIGYGGSLTDTLPIGSIVFADAAFVSDGTSREYLPDAELIRPDRGIARRVHELAEQSGVRLRDATIHTTDAIYRETPSKIAAWGEAGAQVVNMDTAPLYAASKVVGMSAAYACVISDCLTGTEWEAGQGEVRSAMRDLQTLTVRVLVHLANG